MAMKWIACAEAAMTLALFGGGLRAWYRARAAEVAAALFLWAGIAFAATVATLLVWGWIR